MTYGYGGQSKYVLAKSNDKTESKTLITDDTYRSTSSKSIY